MANSTLSSSRPMRSTRREVVESHLENAQVVMDFEARSMTEAVTQLVGRLVEVGQLDAARSKEAIKAVLLREEQAPTALGQGLAVPHARMPDLDGSRIAIGRLRTSLNMDAPDGRPVRFVVLMLVGADAELHLEFLMLVAQMMSDPVFAAEAHLAEDEDAFRQAIQAYFERRHETPPRKTREPDEALRATGRLGGGLFKDVARRWPHYGSDFTDGLNSKSLAASIFLFFACVAPAVAFGGLMAVLTGNQIGPIEMLVATAVGSIIYALLAAQPLTIIGGTGPLLVFTAVLYELCLTLDIPFLPTYAWVGLWTAVLTVILALTDASSLIRYCTRFTDEIFAVLISLIFIVEAVTKLKDFFTSESVGEYSALLSVILAFGTLRIATTLRDFRRSRYLHPTVREFLADFGSIVAIGVMVIIGDYFERDDLPVLSVPDSLRPTTERAWLIDILAVPGWVIAAAILPAVLCTVLVYLDQNITARLVNRKDNRLRKGAGYHLDLLIIGVLIAVCSLFGLPWLVAATVRSLNHVHALSIHDESVTTSGRVKATIVHVYETRLTGIVIGILTGVSLLVLPWAARHGVHIPTAVLLGLFLYMGMNSLGGNQLWERVKLLVMESAHFPNTHYARRVPLLRVHLFTALQLMGLTLLWIVKASPAALLFPLVIALLVPFRLTLARVFSSFELEALDSEAELDALGDSARVK